MTKPGKEKTRNQSTSSEAIKFTPAQQRMLDLLCEGYVAKEISSIRGISKQATSQMQRRAIEAVDAKTIVQVCIMWAEMRKARRLLLQRSAAGGTVRKEPNESV